MSSDFIGKLGYKSLLAVFVIIAYAYILPIGEELAIFLGFREMTIVQFIVSISCSSVVIFIISMLIQFVFQILPITSKDVFTKGFYGLHMLFLYVSGMLVTVTAIQPLLIEAGYMGATFDSIYIQVFVLLFFIILSNYYIYDVIIIQDRLKLLNEKGEIGLVLLYRSALLVVGIIWMVRSLVIGLEDQINVVLGFLVVGPVVINRIFFNNPDISLD